MHISNAVHILARHTMAGLFILALLGGTVQAQTPEEITALNTQIELLIQRINQLENAPTTPLGQRFKRHN
ncbi:MAG: hypothetical protein O3B73_16245 [bacterium]|nr:hypothetical protein [bacterium]